MNSNPSTFMESRDIGLTKLKVQTCQEMTDRVHKEYKKIANNESVCEDKPVKKIRETEETTCKSLETGSIITINRDSAMEEHFENPSKNNALHSENINRDWLNKTISVESTKLKKSAHADAPTDSTYLSNRFDKNKTFSSNLYS